MNDVEFTHFVNKGNDAITVKEIQFNELEQYRGVPMISSPIMLRISHSQSCRLLWEAFDVVIMKASKKKYADESKMRQSMNLMLFNELRKRGIIIRKDNNARY